MSWRRCHLFVSLCIFRHSVLKFLFFIPSMRRLALIAIDTPFLLDDRSIGSIFKDCCFKGVIFFFVSTWWFLFEVFFYFIDHFFETLILRSFIFIHCFAVVKIFFSIAFISFHENDRFKCFSWWQMFFFSVDKLKLFFMETSWTMVLQSLTFLASSRFSIFFLHENLTILKIIVNLAFALIYSNL